MAVSECGMDVGALVDVHESEDTDSILYESMPGDQESAVHRLDLLLAGAG